MDLSLIKPENLRHAYFIEGAHTEVVPQLRTHLNDTGIANGSNIDVRIVPVFYIDDAHALRNAQQMTRDGKKIFIIAFDRMIEWAGHALLKVLEEPTKGTHFFFVGRSVGLLLPTVRSRLLVITNSRDEAHIQGFARDFLASDLYARTEQLKKFIEKARGDNEEDKILAKRTLMEVLDDIEREWSLVFKSGKIHARQFASVAELILEAKRDLADPSPSVKIIFEHISLRIPRIV